MPREPMDKVCPPFGCLITKMANLVELQKISHRLWHTRLIWSHFSKSTVLLLEVVFQMSLRHWPSILSIQISYFWIWVGSLLFVVLDMNKNELTLVCDHQLQVHDPGNGFSFNWARPFEEPVWMLTLPCLPLLFRPNISRHARYMITCYKTYICQHYVIYAFYYVILDGWWSVLLDRYERIHNWFLSVSDFLEVIMCYAISPYLNPNAWFLF